MQLEDYGLSPHDVVRFQRKAGGKWWHGRPKSVNKDGSITVGGLSTEDVKVLNLASMNGVRSLHLDRLEKMEPGPRGGTLWRALGTRNGAESPTLN